MRAGAGTTYFGAAGLPLSLAKFPAKFAPPNALSQPQAPAHRQQAHPSPHSPQTATQHPLSP